MIDVQSYQLMHGKDSTQSDQSREVTRKVVDGDGDDDMFVVQLPPWIQGFNMNEKKWGQLIPFLR